MAYMSDMTGERRQYLEGLAMDYGIDEATVLAVADMLGPNEDHDGLLNMLEDYECMCGGW